MNKSFNIEVSEENAQLLKSMLREEGISYKMRPSEFFQDTNGLIRRGLGTLDIQHDSDFLTPYRRAVKSEMVHALRRISESSEYKDKYNWEYIRENLGSKRDDIAEKILMDEKTFKGMKESVQEGLVASLDKLNTPPKKKKKKR